MYDVVLKSKSLRDIGCGPGAFALAAASLNLYVEAVDINRDILNALAQRKNELNLPRIKIVPMDWLEVPEENMDISVCAYSLSKAIGSMEGIRKVLRTTNTSAYWIVPGNTLQTDFLSKGLYIKFGISPPSFTDNYHSLLKKLENLNVKVSWEIMHYDFGFPFEEEKGMDYYVRFLSNKLHLPYSKAIKKHILEIITERNGLTWIPNPRKSVFITWIRSGPND